MARKNEFGKFIIAAGEIGQYTVCPEAWRLKVVAKARSDSDRTKSVTQGDSLHESWARELDTSTHLLYGLKVAIALVIAMIAVGILYQ